VNKQRLLKRALTGSKNIRFEDMVLLAQAFGFHLSRTRGSHHIFIHPELQELLNLQDAAGQAKPYQIRQFLKLVEKYDLRLEEKP
jgi:predicted RNA binding protein YcfA (HicA-like mRNA interferase family)